jgi:phenylacetate-CoA ligase
MKKISVIFQNFILSNPKRAIWFMTSMPASFWEKQNKKLASKAFREAVENSPAYQDFLRKHSIDPSKIKALEDFQKKIPITSKKNFIQQYSLNDLAGNRFKNVFGICFSSGSTGTPVAFLYNREIFFGAFRGWLSWLEFLWEITSSGPVLFINAAPLGVWSFGYTTSLLFGTLLDKYDITYVTPGLDSQGVIKILKEIGRSYAQVIISTFPSFLRKIFDEGDKEKLEWKKFNLKFQLAGEPLTDGFKNYIFSKVDPARKNPWRIFNLLAAGDAGLIGCGFPLAEMIQKITRENEKFRSMLGINKAPFFIFQYNPLNVFLEEIDGKLLVTSISSISPIIRYQIGDGGKIISFSEMERKLKSCGYNTSDLLRKGGWKKGYFKWPFLIFWGRVDQTVTIFTGAKISPQNLLPLLDEPEAKEIKNFKLTTKIDEKGGVKLAVLLELKPNLKPTSEEMKVLERKYRDLIHRILMTTNIDYRDAYRVDPERTLPEVQFFPDGEGVFKEDSSRPKPKMVI